MFHAYNHVQKARSEMHVTEYPPKKGTFLFFRIPPGSSKCLKAGQQQKENYENGQPLHKSLQYDAHPSSNVVHFRRSFIVSLLHLITNVSSPFCPSHTLNYIINRSPFEPRGHKNNEDLAWVWIMRWSHFNTTRGDTVSLKFLQPVNIISMEQHNSFNYHYSSIYFVKLT